MRYEFVKYGDPNCKKGVTLRIEQFFSDFENAGELINDNVEAASMHMVCVIRNKVLGTGRLTLLKDKGVISQMAVDENAKNKGIGSKILKSLIEKCEKEKIQTIQLSARETAIDFYHKFGFRTQGGKYPSKKTGILHQLMEYNR